MTKKQAIGRLKNQRTLKICILSLLAVCSAVSAMIIAKSHHIFDAHVRQSGCSNTADATTAPVNSIASAPSVAPAYVPVSSGSASSVPEAPVVNVQSVSISRTKISMNQGDTVTLRAAVEPSDATDLNIEWSSTDPYVAKVENGTVTGIAAGSCAVKATSSIGKSAFCNIIVNSSSVPAAQPQQQAVKGFKGAVFNGCSQAVLVTADRMNTIYANLKTYQLVKDIWNQGMDVDARIGKCGLVYADNRIEGDLKTPIGVFALPYAFGTVSNPGTKIPYELIDSNTYYDGMYGSQTYNRLVRGKPNNNEYEYMDIKPYLYGVDIYFNVNQIVGKGNAIFLHYSTDSGYTAGCVSIRAEDLAALLHWLDPSRNPLIVICPISDLSKYYY